MAGERVRRLVTSFSSTNEATGGRTARSILADVQKTKQANHEEGEPDLERVVKYIDLWDGVDLCFEQANGTKQSTKDLATGLVQWSAAEKDYISKIPFTRKKYELPACEEGSLGVVLEVFCSSFMRIGEAKSRLSSVVSAMGTQLHQFRREQNQTKRKLELEGAKLRKAMQAQDQAFQRAKAKYEKSCKDAEQLIALKEKAHQEKALHEVSKLWQRTTDALIIVQESEQQYRLAVEELRAFRSNYIAGMQRILEELQILEESRIEYIKALIHGVIDSYTELANQFGQVVSDLENCVEHVDSRKDTESFVRRNLRPPPEPIVFEKLVTPKIESEIEILVGGGLNIGIRNTPPPVPTSGSMDNLYMSSDSLPTTPDHGSHESPWSSYISSAPKAPMLQEHQRSSSAMAMGAFVHSSDHGVLPRREITTPKGASMAPHFSPPTPSQLAGIQLANSRAMPLRPMITKRPGTAQSSITCASASSSSSQSPSSSPSNSSPSRHERFNSDASAIRVNTEDDEGYNEGLNNSGRSLQQGNTQNSYDQEDADEDVDDMQYVVKNAGHVDFVRALFHYAAEEDSELTMEVDEIIQVLEKDESGWWEGRSRDGRVGSFPENYTQAASAADAKAYGFQLSNGSPSTNQQALQSPTSRLPPRPTKRPSPSPLGSIKPSSSGGNGTTPRSSHLGLQPKFSTQSSQVLQRAHSEFQSEVKASVNNYRQQNQPLEEQQKTPAKLSQPPPPPSNVPSGSSTTALPARGSPNFTRTREMPGVDSPPSLKNFEPPKPSNGNNTNKPAESQVTSQNSASKKRESSFQGDPAFSYDGPSRQVIAIFDYEAQDPCDLTIHKREVLTVHGIDQDGGWLDASDASGNRGMIPANYVRNYVPRPDSALSA